MAHRLVQGYQKPLVVDEETFEKIQQYADARCKKCYGEGKIGTIKTDVPKKIVVCRCIKKRLYEMRDEQKPKGTVQIIRP